MRTPPEMYGTRFCSRNNGPQPERILKAFFRREDIRVPIKRLRTSLPSGAALWIVGGAPRNAIIEAIHGKSPLTEDIDVFIGDAESDRFVNHFLVFDEQK